MSIKSDAEIIRDETQALANTAVRVGGNLVAIADDLVTKETAISTNTSKEGYTEAKVTANVTVSANTAKVGISTAQANEIVVNKAKVTYPSADATKLSGVETGAEVNTINSDTTGEPTGSDAVLNIVTLTQAEYDAGTKVATTFYAING